MSSSGMAKRRAAYHGRLRPLSRRRLRPPCQALRPRLRSRHPSRPTRPPPRPSPRRGRSRSPSSRPSVSRHRPICRRTVVAASAVALTLAGLSSRTRPSRPGLTAGYGVSSRASPDLAPFPSISASELYSQPVFSSSSFPSLCRPLRNFRPLNSGPISLAKPVPSCFPSHALAPSLSIHVALATIWRQGADGGRPARTGCSPSTRMPRLTRRTRRCSTVDP
jgi:hypothetical protein